MRINKRINKQTLFILFLSFFSFLLLISPARAANLTGRILLQVEQKGEAWYVNPENNLRYYLGRPDDAFRLMRQLGLGVSNSNINNFLSSGAPLRLSGRILLQVEDKGQAYYVSPVDLKLYYLGRPYDAFQIMRSLGLGISDVNLNKIYISPASNISSARASNPDLKSSNYIFKYKNIERNLNLALYSSIYNNYQSSTKVLKYYVDAPPDNLQESFYDIFLNSKANDNSIEQVSNSLLNIAKTEKLNDDELAELALAFVQYIPYDTDKSSQAKIKPYYPYETLYLNKGVCSDKVFLGYKILENLGYGVAIIDLPDKNHSALGLLCPAEYSLNNSGYCYAETTNYFPISVIPQNINNGGQAEGTFSYKFSDFFSTNNLGKIEINNASSGKAYYGADEIRSQAKSLSELYEQISNTESLLDASYSEVVNYNARVKAFNDLVTSFYQK